MDKRPAATEITNGLTTKPTKSAPWRRRVTTAPEISQTRSYGNSTASAFDLRRPDDQEGELFEGGVIFEHHDGSEDLPRNQ